MSPSELKKGCYYKIVANAGHFNHMMRVTSAYNGFYMLETDAGSRHTVGWKEMNDGAVVVYGQAPEKVDDAATTTG